MTFLKKKFAEAEELLLKVREKQFVFFIAPNTDDAREFIEYFYSGLLQSKKWHISDNNKWKVIEFDLKDDVYIETIEKILEKNIFTDRRVSLDFESTIIQNLREQKTSLNKLYRSFQYAYNYNYLFCLFLKETSEELFLEQMAAIRLIFETAVRKKAEPLYCILSLNLAQLSILEKRSDLWTNLSEGNVIPLPVLTSNEIEVVLNEFPLFKGSKEHNRNELIEDITNSDDILLQLKNATRKLSVGIMPLREVVNKPLQIKKESSLKINVIVKEDDHTTENNIEAIIVDKPELELPLDKLFNSLGTRYQRNNFKKILLIAFQLSEEKTLLHNDLNGRDLSSIIKINEKDIENAINPFVQNKYIYYDADSKAEIRFVNTNAFYQWPFLLEICSTNIAISTLFEKVYELISLSPIDTISQQLNTEAWSLLDRSDLDFYLEFYSYKFPGLNENIKLLKELGPDFKIELDNTLSQNTKIKFGNPDKITSIPDEENTNFENEVITDEPESIMVPNDYNELFEDITSVDIIESSQSLNIEIKEDTKPLINDESPIADDIFEVEFETQILEFENPSINSIDQDISIEEFDDEEIEEGSSLSHPKSSKALLKIKTENNPIDDEPAPSELIPVITENETPIAEISKDEIPPPNTFKIRPMTIRPTVENEGEQSGRPKLTFKKKE